MLGVVAVGVARHDRDDSVVVRVKLFRAELPDLVDDSLVRGVEFADDLPRVPAARADDDSCVEFVRVVNTGKHPFPALTGRAQTRGGALLPCRSVGDQILKGPASRGLLLEPGKADRPDSEAEADPRRLHQTQKIVGRPDRRADICVVVGIVAGRVPLDHIERELLGVFG